MIPGLQPAVEMALPSIFAAWEGRGLPYPYTDRKGFVTVGTGNLIDPVSTALPLPWKVAGALISAAEVRAQWQRVKAAWPAVQSIRCAPLTTMRLDADALAVLVRGTVAADWHGLCAEFPTAPGWPADAQLALLSIAWAWGAGFPYVWDRIGGPAPGFGYGAKFRSLLSDPPEFAMAAGVMMDASVHEEQINPGIVPRDKGEIVMLQNAATVAAAGGDPSKLWFPAVAA